MSFDAINTDKLRIAAPCRMNWEQMRGDDRTRFCDLCQLRVYNISGLSRKEIQRLIATADGRICARLYRRADGTVLTRDCVVGVRALRRRVAKRTVILFAGLMSLAGSVFGQEGVKASKASCKPQVALERTIQKGSKKLLTGVVLDPNGAVIPFIKITLTNQSSQQVFKTETRDDGSFELTSVLPGDYSLQINFPGFKPLEIKLLTLRENETAHLRLILQPSDTTQTIGILAADDLIDRPTNTTILDERLLRQLPIHK